MPPTRLLPRISTFSRATRPSRAQWTRRPFLLRPLTTSSKPHQASVAPLRVDHAESTDNQTVAAMGRTSSGKALKIRKYPAFKSLEDERLYRKQHLAAAYRVFAERGFDEGVAGHISVRDPVWTDHFWLNPLSTHFSQIRVSDLILVNEAGEVVQGDQPINAAAFAIHSAIHQARPDVHAACHAHSVYGKAFSAFGRELDMITQDSLRFYKSHGVYQQFGGVVLASEEGRRIAEALGNGKAAILQNHGILTVGHSVDEAAFWFLSLDKTCQAQLLVDAAAAGRGHKPQIIPDEEAAESYKQVGTPEKGWLAFQGYYDEILARTGGDFLR
ncbi:class II aldolase/adducin domain-containing protein [Trematosphaeria pertusa]|uniref:Class II aldolase/adducin domain-containing protein n=1 Tax=Trematosphaeria pertusa TaxID=390896 RepID=A0A6A6IM72_9PLEO|nr:class II aldolase/adducin domain-containing protein [Trematosphaeria pertusa]KAF2250922.1 class II aldolase/adducin domain-containing protein [Trematosphaeria pertusa]